MRLLRAALILALLPALASADSFGRFGYQPLADVPEFVVDAKGVAARGPGADTILFPAPSKTFAPTETSATGQTVALDCGKTGPTQVRSSLVGASVDLYFPNGLDLRLGCHDAPFLSWKDGSVGPNVPTPKTSWILLSFASEQPAVMLGFSGATTSLVLTGSPDHWLISSPGFSGWLRLMLPLGQRSVKATDAAGLGDLAARVSREGERWALPTPSVKRVSIKSDDLAIDATWEFDGPGAIVPPAVLLAEIAGYSVALETPHHTLPGETDYGPLEAVDGQVMTVHFPIRRIMTGRALGLGPAAETPLATASPYDIPSVVELALQSLLAHRDPALAKLADDTSTKFLSDANYVAEPFTRQQMPYQADGTGLDLAAAHALLVQATDSAVDSQEPNSLFASVAARRDWWTWALWAKDPLVSRRATALASLAGALSQDVGNRLLGATLEAGFAAQRGLTIWRKRAGLVPAEPALSEPMLELRQGFFALSPQLPPYFSLLQSPLRVASGAGLSLLTEADGLTLRWSCLTPEPSVITFLQPTDLGATAKENLAHLILVPSQHNLALFYRPNFSGTCAARLILPPSLPPIPAQCDPPEYSEAIR